MSKHYNFFDIHVKSNQVFADELTMLYSVCHTLQQRMASYFLHRVSDILPEGLETWRYEIHMYTISELMYMRLLIK